MAQTETGWRCDPCTDALDASSVPGECIGCDYSEKGCTRTDGVKCPLTAPKTEEPHGPMSAEEESKGRARAELAARAMAVPCVCQNKRASWRWKAADRHDRVGVLICCSSCRRTYQHFLTRDDVWSVVVCCDSIKLSRLGMRAIYRIAAIDAVSVCHNTDYDLLSFRTGNETQCYKMADAEPIIKAVGIAWSQA
jgi:hypothetical protein